MTNSFGDACGIPEFRHSVSGMWIPQSKCSIFWLLVEGISCGCLIPGPGPSLKPAVLRWVGRDRVALVTRPPGSVVGQVVLWNLSVGGGTPAPVHHIRYSEG